MITRVKLKNWKCHHDTDLKLGDGTNVLVGTMGAGKSSILHAITYALFGTLPEVQTRRAKLEDMITARPTPAATAEVEVRFVGPDDEEYIVKRVIDRKEGTKLSELRKASGELIESPSATRVNELIGSILKLDYDLFERAIYSEQNRIDHFLTLPPGKRMESIDELLGIDKLELARKNAGKLATSLKEMVDERERSMRQLKQDLELEALPAYEEELKNLEAELERGKQRLSHVQPELQKTRSELQKFQEMETKLAELEKSEREVEGSIHESSKQIEQLKRRLGRAAELSPEALKQQITGLESKFNERATLANELSSKFTVSSSNIGGMETRISMISERLEKVLPELEGKKKAREELGKLDLHELSKLVEELQEKLRGAADELVACRARIKDLHQTTSELAEAGSTCPVCESPLDERKKQQLLEQKRGQLESSLELESRLESRVKEFDQELRQKIQLKDKAQALTREAEDLPALEAEYSELSKELERLKRELEEERKELEKMRGELEMVNQEVQKLRDDFTSAKQTLQLRLDLERMEEDNRKKLAERLELQEELDEVKSSYEKVRVTELRDRYERLIQEQGHLQAHCAGIEQLILEKRKAVNSIRERQALIRRREVEIKNLHEAISAMGVIQTAFIRTQLALREQFIEGVNGAMEELWSCIYPYGDFNGIRLAVIKERKSGDYVLQLRDRRGNWIPVDGVASGGERTDACLTLRIAFAVVLAPALRWIILDEPTHNLDAEGIQELARVLRERLPEVVKQVIVITHEERLEAAVSGYLYKFSRDKNRDEPTRVEQVTAPELISETP